MISGTHRTTSHFSFCRMSGKSGSSVETSLASVSNARLEMRKYGHCGTVNMYWSNGHGTG
jgi:hypothetical protein